MFILTLAGGIFLIAIVSVIWAISTYNQFIILKERVSNARAQVAAQIESRWDAISNLIDATQKYEKHEVEVLENITRLRTGLEQNSSIGEIEHDDSQFNQVYGKIIAVAESNPDLKANTVYQSTIARVDKFENYVRNARMIYNDCVTKLNRKIKIFPSSVIANMFNFSEEGYFEADEAKQKMPSWD